MLISDTEQYNPPTCEINPNRSLLSTLHSFMTVSMLEFIKCIIYNNFFKSIFTI